jgi:hypothetical protein
MRVGLRDGVEVGFYRLGEIFEEVRTMSIENDTVLREELLNRVETHNWLPQEKKDEFAVAILAAYKDFCKKADSG